MQSVISTGLRSRSPLSTMRRRADLSARLVVGGKTLMPESIDITHAEHKALKHSRGYGNGEESGSLLYRCVLRLSSVLVI